VISKNREDLFRLFRLGRYFFLLLPFLSSVSFSQIRPEDLSRDFLVKFIAKDSSEFFGLVLSKPTRDLLIVETRNGRLEIPTKDISYTVDYRFNFVLRDDLRKSSLKHTAIIEKKQLTYVLLEKKASFISGVRTNANDYFKGMRYLFDDTAHLVLATKWGELYFTYPEINYIDNYSGDGKRREDFFTTAYLKVRDPRAGQGYITPNALSYEKGSSFLANYFLAGLQGTYAPTDWLSVNVGGTYLPFFEHSIITATAGIKASPYSTDRWHIALGAQGLYAEVVKTTRFAFTYGVVTYGTWESHLSLLGGLSFKRETDSTNFTYTKRENVLAVQGGQRVGENLKVNIELFFVSNFEIVPALAMIRYFQNNLTIDIGVVFSLYKAGAARVKPSIGEIVFGVKDFEIIPVISGSYHF
jgi:hypothetical protein